MAEEQKNTNQEFNIDLNPDTIMGYLVTTQNYSEPNEDGRKRDIFYWKAYHFYPFVAIPTGDEDEEATPDNYDDIEEFDAADLELAICTEGPTNNDQLAFIPMTAGSLKDFVRDHPSFRILTDIEDLFEGLNIY